MRRPAPKDPHPASVEDLIAGIETKAFLYQGRPAMALVLRLRNSARPWITFPHPFILVENEDGTPLAGKVPDYRWEQGTMGDPGVQAEFSVPLVMSWLTGECAWSLAASAHDDLAFQKVLFKAAPKAQARIAELVEATLPSVGFSETFVESLRCIKPWAVNPGHVIRKVFGTDALGQDVRNFARRYPLLCSLKLPMVLHKANAGPVSISDVYPKLGPRRAAALEGPAWPKTGQTFEQVVVFGSNPDEFADFVGSVPAEWIRPDGVMQVRNFLRTYLLSRCLIRTGADVATLVRPSHGDWVAFHRRCRDAAGKVRLLDRWESPKLDSYLIDPLADFAKRVVLPVMARAGLLPGEKTRPDPRLVAETVALRILYREKSLPGCYEAARKWHDHLPAIMAAMPDEGDSGLVPWRALFEETVIDGITLKPLLSAAEIEAEGTKGKDASGVPGLDHCVASYRSQARRGEAHIVSLRRVKRNGGFIRLATAELAQDAKGRIKLVQLHGKGNGDPPARSEAAMDAFLKANPRLPVLVPNASAYDDHVRDLCGYDWSDAGNVRRACLAYAMMVPRGLRADPDALAATILQEWASESETASRLAA